MEINLKMKILFTGASSFTGFHFLNELAKNTHHEVHIILSKDLNYYTDSKKKRIDQLDSKIIIHENIQFGDNAFLDLIQSKNKNFEILCCHGAYVENYNSDNFDIHKSLVSNTKNISKAIKLFKENGGKIIINTGSIFEPYEGFGEENSNAFNLYGISKHFTNELFRYHCYINKITFGKFVIPNPFGILEEPRFTNYLFSCWRKNEIPIVKTPRYIRDNIPVELLARSYVDFLHKLFQITLLGNYTQEYKFTPSGYVESQGDFTNRIIKQIQNNFNIFYSVKFYDQTIFDQPISRYNNTCLFSMYPDWDESKFWIQYINTYLNLNDI